MLLIGYTNVFLGLRLLFTKIDETSWKTTCRLTWVPHSCLGVLVLEVQAQPGCSRWRLALSAGRSPTCALSLLHFNLFRAEDMFMGLGSLRIHFSLDFFFFGDV